MKYDYICPDGHKTTVNYPMSVDKPESIECEECGAKAMRKFSSVPFRFMPARFQTDNTARNVNVGNVA